MRDGKQQLRLGGWTGRSLCSSSGLSCVFGSSDWPDGQRRRYSFRIQLEGRFAQFLEKLLDKGLAFLFQDSAGHGDPVVQLRL